MKSEDILVAMGLGIWLQNEEGKQLSVALPNQYLDDNIWQMNLEELHRIVD